MLLDMNAPHANLPPRVFATDPAEAVYSAATAAAATSTSIWGSYVPLDNGGAVGVPKGKVWLELEALGQVAYVRFSRTATTATTTANGAVCAVGVPRYFYVDPTKDLFFDHIAAGVGTLKWRVVSAIGERNRQ